MCKRGGAKAPCPLRFSFLMVQESLLNRDKELVVKVDRPFDKSNGFRQHG